MNAEASLLHLHSSGPFIYTAGLIIYIICLLHGIVGTCQFFLSCFFLYLLVSDHFPWLGNAPLVRQHHLLTRGAELSDALFPAPSQLKHRHDWGSANNMHFSWEAQSVKTQGQHRIHWGEITTTSRFQHIKGGSQDNTQGSTGWRLCLLQCPCLVHYCLLEINFECGFTDIISG